MSPSNTTSSVFSSMTILRTLIMVIAAVALCATVAHSGVIERTYRFEQPTVMSVEIDGQVYDRIHLPGAPSSGRIAHPALPAFGARLLIPYGESVSNVDVICGEKHLIGDDYLVEPVEQPFALSTPPDKLPPLRRDEQVYAMTEPIPAAKYATVSVQTLHGYRILVLQLFPVEYTPSTGRLTYFSELTVRVTTEATGAPRVTLRNKAADVTMVSSKIDNPSELATYAAAMRQGSANYNMLIITLSSFVSSFEPLKEYHDSTGVLTEIHTLAEIGSANPHTVRDYIRQEYLNNGITYVLIGADDDFIPALDLYAKSWDRPDALIEYDMPGDFYFACLDGTFDYDGDGLYGEPTDGEGGGDIDLFPEVHVGRFSAGTAAEVTNLTYKTLNYLHGVHASLEKVLLAGEQLTFGGLGEYGGYAMDEMVNASDAHGFVTYAFPDDVYDIEKLYDVNRLPWNYWWPSEMIDRINSGVHIIDHLGHSYIGYAMRTDTVMLASQLTNTDYSFIYAEGCTAGHFDYYDCWAEFMTTRLPTGAFGCIANSRSGLGSRSTRHPVHIFNREFWDAVYDANEAKPQLGRAISDARIDHVYHINEPAIRWNYYEINLFGDPAAAIRSVSSIAITFPTGVPETVPPDSAITFEVLANGIGQGVPAPNSGVLHCSVDGAEPTEIPMTAVAPNRYEATLPPLTCGSRVDFYVSVDDTGGTRCYQPVPSTPCVATPVSEEIIIFQDDFETDQGWTISGGLWERGVPLGLGGGDLQYPVPDPTEGCLGPNVMGYNLSGDYENNLPETHVTSPPIDCSDMARVHLRFCRWLGVERPAYDHARVLISTDGSVWTQLWENPATIGDLEWNQIEFDISAIADSQASVYLRWTMGPTDGGLRFNGWNIDDVRLVSLDCQRGCCNTDGIRGDADNDCAFGCVTVADLSFLVDFLFNDGAAPLCEDEANGDADCTFGCITVADLSYLVEYLFNDGSAPPPCP